MARIILMFTIAAAITVACTTTGSPGLFSANGLQQIQLTSDPQANTNMATELDIVFIYDQQLASALPDSAEMWFQQRNALLISHAQAMESLLLQIPPAMPVDAVRLPKMHKRALSVRLYVKYVMPQPAIELSGYTCARVTLKPETVSVAACQ